MISKLYEVVIVRQDPKKIGAGLFFTFTKILNMVSILCRESKHPQKVSKCNIFYFKTGSMMYFRSGNTEVGKHSFDF